MVKFTDNQQKAITHNGHNILVSASAGSGKTAVLVQRVIEEIQTIDVDQLLIVTFTRAAAQEMKERIQRAIQNEISALQVKAKLSTADKTQLHHDRRQLNRLNLANISTIHAFCEQVIHRFYYLINMDPEFSILEDSTQGTLFKQNVFADLREAYYNADDLTFFKLTENFSNDRDDQGLEDMVFKVYDYMRAFADPNAWLASLPAQYRNQPNILDNAAFKTTILPQLTTALNGLSSTCQQAQAQFSALGLEKQPLLMAQVLTNITQIQSALAAKNYQDLRTNLQVFDKKLTWFRYKKNEADVEAESRQLSQQIDDQVAGITELVTNYFILSEDQLRDINDHCQQLLTKFVEVMTGFSENYQTLKRQRNLIDFSDLEHFAYDILNYQDDQGQQPARAFYQHKFSEVLIDEYQDINPLQESLLGLVAKTTPGNRFMVGDIKQSIYGFRMADPTLFAHKYATYGDGAKDQDERIVLAENFRSQQTITDFVNYIFAQLMDQQLGDISYDQNAYLRFGATYYPADQNPVEVLLTTSTSEDTTADPAKTDEAKPLDVSPAILTLAQRITTMVQHQELIYDNETGEQRPVTYGDIAVLVSTRHANLDIIDTFKKAAIPVIVNDTQNYFQTTELRIMLALLELIDNPDQDIPLVAVLRSPIVGLDENELGFIRGNDPQKNQSFYECLQQVETSQSIDLAVCQPDFLEKIGRFLTDLTSYRDMARANQLADLIWTIYNTTGFLDYVSGMPSGPQRSANLQALYDRAKQYEANGFKGVFQFVRFIQQMQANDKDLGQPNVAQENLEAVQVMTIHKSKGLEFPVVFVFDLEHQFNTDASRQKFALNQQLGLGLDYLTDQRILVPTVQKKLIQAVNHQMDLAEELRLLYVALTRAQQRLILVADLRDATRSKNSPEAVMDRWADLANDPGLHLPLATKLKAKSFLDFIGPALIRGQKEGVFADHYVGGLFDDLPHQVSAKFVKPNPLTPSTPVETKIQTSPKQVIELSPSFTQLIQRRFNQTYPNLAATKTTAYQSVSDIKRQFDDPDLDTLVPLDLENSPQAFSVSQLNEPEFLRDTAHISATQLGTATHLIFQKVDLTQPLTLDSLKNTAQHLVAQGLLTQPLSQRLDLPGILSFFKTDLGEKIQQHPQNFHREVTFSMVYPANQLFDEIDANDPGNVLIHGMIDGYYRSDNELILVDYKTDHADNQTIVNRYQGQLNLYALALGNICQQEVSHKYLYGLHSQELIPLK
ncbi:MAG: helicase-exonuclease AddAB subunit AddA [Lactobacillus sp.]|jgi:ATP-dependent helicase/nuclease subunit A|nr:helicase-exonuclease AddAB subunit AddA [Lactobacillus sp.]